MTFDGRTATTFVMFSIFAGATIMATGLPTKAAFMPLLIGIPGTLLCLWQLIIDLRRREEPPVEAPESDQEHHGQTELQAFFWLGVFFVILLCFGFIVGAPLVVAAFVRFSSRESWRTTSFAAGGTFAVMYGVFILLLELPVFEGLILERLL